MARFRPRFLLLVATVVAAAILVALADPLEPLGAAAVVLIVGAVVLVSLAAREGRRRGRKNAMDAITDGVRTVVGGGLHEQISIPESPGELGDLARSVEEMRRVLVERVELFDQQKEVMRRIVDSLREGLLAIDRDRIIVLANRRAIELFSLREQVVGWSFFDVVRHSALLSAFDLALSGEASVNRTAVRLRDQERRIEIRTLPVASASEIAAVALFIDVTDIERLEAIRRDFLDDFSHEVRTPLAGLRSAIESFVHGSLTPDQQQHLRAILLRQLARLERLVADISELNQIESGDLVLHREATELHRLLADLSDDFRSRPGNESADIRVEGQVALEANVDPIKVQQIFSNLIDNALKHAGADRRVDITLRDEGDSALVAVTDYGEGIPIREQERIFHRFYRVDRSRSDGAGSGLGLAIAKHLVLRHGGTISVHSAPGAGATFEVRLPR
ncbi:MAG TPA: ATP-binding protein [Thermoanaerobaculia bacterium]|nr:ATP-binding protein [Thermoanaerobaculia bacterium]